MTGILIAHFFILSVNIPLNVRRLGKAHTTFCIYKDLQKTLLLLNKFLGCIAYYIHLLHALCIQTKIVI